MENFGEQFLDNKDPKLKSSADVEHEQRRKQKLGEKYSQDPEKRISDWMEVLERTHEGHIDDPKVWERVKNYYHDKHIIKPENIQESVFLLEQRIAREMGYGNVEITEEFKQRKIEQITSDQKESLDRWLDYLASKDADYPMWAKYWAFTSVVAMGKFEKIEEEKEGKKIEKGKFIKRRKDTAAAFPTLNPRALAMTIGVMSERLSDEEKEVANKSTKLDDKDFQKLLSSENFSEIYTQFLIEMPEYSTEGLQETRGEWVKYPRNSDARPLVDSLQGYPLEWCTANYDTAMSQLQGGDFYVYYSINQDGEPVIPRLAIRMEEDKISEVRGIASRQNIDPFISDVAKEKLKEFPDGPKYEKKSADMKRLTEIERKTKNNQELTKEDLIFLYEMDDSIEGFGYEKDPRIEEILENRDTRVDYPIIFDCKIEEIVVARPDLINENTKVYSFGEGKIDYKVLSKLRPDMKVYAKLPNKPLEFVRPQSLDYEELSKERSGRQMRILNQDMMGVDLEKAKVFTPDLSRFKGKPRYEVMRHVAETYGDKYIMPGLEYQDYVIKNPDKFPQFKDNNYYFFPGSIFRDSYGSWCLPCSVWSDGRFYPYSSDWLYYVWDSKHRLVLLEI